jgi:hypothetical protein
LHVSFDGKLVSFAEVFGTPILVEVGHLYAPRLNGAVIVVAGLTSFNFTVGVEFIPLSIQEAWRNPATYDVPKLFLDHNIHKQMSVEGRSRDLPIQFASKTNGQHKQIVFPLIEIKYMS